MAKKSQRKPAKRTWKAIVPTLVVMFMISFGIGYLNGTTARSKPEFLLPRALTHIQVEVNPKSYFLRGVAPKYSLVFVCADGSTPYSFDVETKSLSQDARSASRYAFDESTWKWKLGEAETQQYVLALLGGGTAWKVTDFLASVQNQKAIPEKIRDFVFMVSACLSGYEVGYLVATSKAIKCESPEFQNFLNNTNNWMPIENLVWLRTYYDAVNPKTFGQSVWIRSRLAKNEPRYSINQDEKYADQGMIDSLVQGKRKVLMRATESVTVGINKSNQDFQNVCELAELTAGSGFTTEFFEYWRASPEDRVAAQRAIQNRTEFFYPSGYRAGSWSTR